MSNLNMIILEGIVVNEIALRQTKKEKKSVCTFTLGVKRLANAGTDFINITAYGHLAELCSTTIVKGSLVSIIGRATASRRKTTTGIDIPTFEVIANEIRLLRYPAEKVEKKKKLEPANEKV